MSTDLITYLNYMGAWKAETDANMNAVINEFNLFLELGNFDATPIVNKEFKVVTDLAKEVRDKTIEADAVDILADAAATLTIWSFGWGTAAFAVLEADAIRLRGVVSKKSEELNKKLANLDSDIASQVSKGLKDYLDTFKANNILIADKAPKGLDPKASRSILYEFMANVYANERKLDAMVFNKYASAIDAVLKTPEIEKIYDALDDLNEKNIQKRLEPEDVTKFINTLIGLDFPLAEELQFIVKTVQVVSIVIVKKTLSLQNDKINKAIDEATKGTKAEQAAAMTELINKTDVYDKAKAKLEEKQKALRKLQDQGAAQQEIDTAQAEVEEALEEATVAAEEKINAKATADAATAKITKAETIAAKYNEPASATELIKGEFSVTLMVLISIVSALLEVLDIVNVVKQCKKMCEELDTNIKQNYIAYFNQLKASSKAYREVLTSKQK